MHYGEVGFFFFENNGNIFVFSNIYFWVLRLVNSNSKKQVFGISVTLSSCDNINTRIITSSTNKFLCSRNTQIRDFDSFVRRKIYFDFIHTPARGVELPSIVVAPVNKRTRLNVIPSESNS